MIPHGADAGQARLRPPGAAADIGEPARAPAAAAGSGPTHLSVRPRRQPGWPSDRVLRWGLRAWSAVGMLVLGYLLVRLVGYVRVLLIPLLAAGVVVYLLNPIVGWLHRRGLPRVLGAAVAYLAALAVLGGGLVLAGPMLAEQVRAAVAALPTDLETAEAEAQLLADRLGVSVDVDFDGSRVQQWLLDNRDDVVRSLTGLGSATASVLSSLAVALIGAVAAFYVLVDLPRLGSACLALVPPPRRAEVTDVARAVSTTVGGFLRGQLLVAGFVGVASALVMWLIGLPLWLLVGLVAGVTNLVPFIGPFIGGGLAVVIALVNGEPLLALWAVLAITVVQQVESHVVSPLVMGRTVQLHPVVVMLAVLLGGSLAGFLGLLVAVPIAASLRILLRHLWQQESSYSDDLLADE